MPWSFLIWARLVSKRISLLEKPCGIKLNAFSLGVAGEETRSVTEKRCSHNLQSGHPAWWSADNCSIFPTVNELDFLEARSEPAEEIRNA